MGKEHSISTAVKELNDIIMPDYASSPGNGYIFRWQDLPMIICIVMRIAGHLLAWSSASYAVAYSP